MDRGGHQRLGGTAAAAASASHRRHSSFNSSNHSSQQQMAQQLSSASAESSPSRKISSASGTGLAGSGAVSGSASAVATEANIKEFLDGPFLQWLRTFPEAPAEITFETLTSGSFLHNVLQTLDNNFTSSHLPENESTSSSSSGTQPDFLTKVNNVQSLISSLKTYYENVLDQVLVVSLPSALTICAEPVTRESLDEMNTVLLLILGAAVQCNQNETVIGSIKNLPTSVQHSFVSLIQEVTDNPSRIWPADLCNPDDIADASRKDEMYALLVRHLRTLVQERDKLQTEVVDLTLKGMEVSFHATTGAVPGGSSGSDTVRERNHLALEVSELKAKIRGLNQEMQEKTDVSNECKEEVEKYITKCSKLRQENLELSQKAREARALKDELDVQRERAQKVHSLEAEIQVYKDKICQNESLKSRVDEMREENKILVEHKQMLEEQLESSRKRIQTILSLESELYMVKRELGVCQMEMESDKKKIEELQEENSALQLSSKSSLSESASLMAEMQNSAAMATGNMMASGSGTGSQAMSEQLMNKDSLLIHKLELENQRLRSELDEVKLNGLREQSEKLLELEQEVKRKDLTLKQVEAERSKDSSQFVTLEKELHQSTNKVQQLEQVVTTLKEADKKTQIEKDTIIDSLNKQIDSLRRRGEQSANEQLKILEQENKKLVAANTLLEGSHSRLTEEKKQLSNRLGDLESKHDEALDEQDKLSQQIKSIKLEREQLVTAKDAALQQRAEELESAREKLHKTNDKLKKDLSELYTENSKVKLELKQSAKTLDSLRTENKRIPSLESEKEDLMDQVNKLRITMENLTVSSKKLEGQEQKLVAVNLENNRLIRQVENLQKKVREVEKENATLESENQKLESHIDNLKATARRVEQLERDNCELESSQHRLDREHKSLSREVHRLRESGELKDTMIDDLNTKLSSTSREKQKLASDLDQVVGEQSRFRSLEQENRTLNQTLMADKKALAKLRKDLVDEKMRFESVTAKLEALQNQLQMIGIDPEAFDGAEELLSQERAHNMQGAMAQLLEGREKKLERQEIQLTALKNKNQELVQELECLRIKVQAGDAKSSLESQLRPVILEREQLKEELVKIKIDMDSSAKKISVYEAKLKKTQEENVQIQVENSTLQSQSTSLLSQINTLQNSNVTLEMAKKRLEESVLQWQNERDELLQDQSGLQKLHDNLQAEYESLKKEKDVQRDVEKQLRADLRKLQSMSLSLNEDQEKIVRAKEALDAEREAMKGDTRTLANLRSEHARLKEDFRSLFTASDTMKSDYRTLQTEYKGLKSSYNEMKLSQTQMKGQLEEAREQFTMLDVEHTKAVNRCEVLSTLNMSLEEDRKNLMSQVSLLLTQYHDLLTTTMDDKEHFHEEERVLAEKMNHLSRQKEKLEEKIMEQYKRMENSTPKKIGFGGQLVRKMKKASSNLIMTGSARSSNRNSIHGGVAVPGSGQSSSGGSHRAGGGRASVPNSVSAGANLGSLDIESAAGVGIHGHHPDSCSSVGNDSNDSLGSGQHSPSPDMLVRSDEFKSRSLKLVHGGGYSAGVRGRPLPIHMDDSDGNNADCDDNSVNSYNIKSRTGGGGGAVYNGVGTNDHVMSGGFHDHIPTRDFGPDRLMGNSSMASSCNHSELGIPLHPPASDNRGASSRSISRVYVNGKDVSSSGPDRSGTPNSGWKSSSSTGSPVPSNDGNGDAGMNGNINGAPPSVPARRHSRAGNQSDGGGERPPQRPPKPGRLQPELVDSNRLADMDDVASRKGAAASSAAAAGATAAAAGGNGPENAEWYEYGCV